MKRNITLRTYSDCADTGDLGVYDIPRKSDGKIFSFYYDKRNTTTLNCLKDVVRGEYRELNNWLMSNDVDILLDVGSHMGSFGIHCAEYVDLVICIEPNNINYSFLVENGKLNDVDNIVYIPGAVIHNYEPWVRFMFHITNSTDSTVHERMNSLKTEVRAFNFYNIVQTFGVNAVKMDIEGEEIPIILNADPGILSSIDFMILEYHEHLLSENYGKRKSEKISYMDDVLKKLKSVFHVDVRGSGAYCIIVCENRRFK